MNPFLLVLVGWLVEYICVGVGYALSFVAIMNADDTEDPMSAGEIFHVITCWPYYVWLDHAEGKK